jgi:tRNA wybutosine-synthesizing protein 3
VKKMSKTRFEMIKLRHKKTFEEALRKGKIDKPLLELCEFVSKTKNYFTSSHCSGRIMLLNSDLNEEKKTAAFYRKWHRKVEFKELINSLNECNYPLWFKMEPFILHIGCGTIENAKKLIELKNNSGIKRGGIMVLSEGKIILELTGTQYISIPLKEKKMLLNENALKIILKTANKKMDKNIKQIKKLTLNAKKILK